MKIPPKAVIALRAFRSRTLLAKIRSRTETWLPRLPQPGEGQALHDFLQECASTNEDAAAFSECWDLQGLCSEDFVQRMTSAARILSWSTEASWPDGGRCFFVFVCVSVCL